MTMMGNAVVAHEMACLRRLMEKNKDLPLEEQLATVREHIQDMEKSAESGWL